MQPDSRSPHNWIAVSSPCNSPPPRRSPPMKRAPSRRTSPTPTAGLRADNLPETVKGALFARYSRSAKSLRRLFLDEFLGDADGSVAPAADEPDEVRPWARRRAAKSVRARAERVRRRFGRAARRRASRLRRRVERPDQGARVGPPDGVSRAVDALRALHRSPERPLEVPRAGRSRARSPASQRFARTLDLAFETYARWIPAMEAHFRAKYPEVPRRLRRRVSVGHPRQGARHAARPAAGGDDVERRAVRHRPGLRGAAAADVRASARGGPRRTRGRCSTSCAQVIPAFLARVDQPDRGGRWIEYLADDASIVRMPRRDASWRRSGREPSDRGDPHRVRSRRRDQGRGVGALRVLGACPTISCSRWRAG